MSSTNAPSFDDIAEMSYETAYTELDTIVTRLESGDLPLEESVALYERGQALAKHCQGLLDAAELRITELDDLG